MKTVLLVLILLSQTKVQSAIEYIDPDPKTGTSKAVVVDRCLLAHTTQLLPIGAAGGIVGKGEPSKQVEQVLANLQAVLGETRSTWDDLIKLNVYVAHTEVVAVVKDILARRFSSKAKPAVSYVVGTLTHSEALVAMDVVAVSKLDPERGVRRLRERSGNTDSPFASVAVLPAGPAVYVSGQAERGEIPDATRKTMESLITTLAHLGLNRSHIVQLKAFMRPLSEVALVKKEVARFFDGELAPPMSFVEWISTTPIEIELIAAAPEPLSRTADSVSFFTPPGINASPVYSRVARLDSPKTIYTSGLDGVNADTAEGEIRDIFESLRAILGRTGSDFLHLVKATYYVASDDASTKLNQLRPNYYDPKRPPAASKAMVRGVGVSGKSVTLDMIAAPAGR